MRTERTTLAGALAAAASLMTSSAVAYPSAAAINPGDNSSSGGRLPLPQRLVTQFPDPTWLENVAVRANGDLLATAYLPEGLLYRIADPSDGTAPPSPRVSVAFNLSAAVAPGRTTGLVGIAETPDTPDVFAVVGAVTDPATNVTDWALYGVDFTVGADGGAPAVRTLAPLPDAQLPNGAAALPSGGVVLVADSTAGRVWRVDVASGSVAVAAQGPAFAAQQQQQQEGGDVPLGVNGLKVARSSDNATTWLYWTNSDAASIYRLRLTARGFAAPGAAPQLVAQLAGTSGGFVDDFAIRQDTGEMYAATNHDGTLLAVRADGSRQQVVVVVVVAGSATSLALAGDTACAFGRGHGDREVLYVVTSGALGDPVNGTVTEGGKVVAVDTAGFAG
ncbi:hypothetical protein F4780DRAFT_798701 [Xylariomycetidae sp. FL0641]|nr:hypothetical protein F4780DRAFT_798701 [Xylariomycetidae sp. FL0641]